MGFFTDNHKADYALRRKFAVALIRWEASIGTPQQFRTPRIVDLVANSEFENMSSRLFNMFDQHKVAIWGRLYRADPTRFFVGEHQASTLSNYGAWDKAKPASAAELAARNRTSSGMPMVYSPTIVI